MHSKAGKRDQIMQQYQKGTLYSIKLCINVYVESIKKINWPNHRSDFSTSLNCEILRLSQFIDKSSTIATNSQLWCIKKRENAPIFMSDCHCFPLVLILQAVFSIKYLEGLLEANNHQLFNFLVSLDFEPNLKRTEKVLNNPI